MLAVPLAACNDIANPLYCDENSDCRNGTICNVDTHGCESVPSVDAMSDGVGPDGPYVARTVQEVRASSTPVETFVELTGVVVTAVDKYGPRTGEFWVQDSGGGPSSGIHIYGGIATEVAALDVGDVVDIGNARKVTFTLGGDTTGRVEIELTPRIGGNLTIEKTGTGLPVHMDMDVSAIAALTQPQLDQEREKWAGMLVRVTLVRAEGPTETVTSVQQFSIGPFFVNDTETQLPSGIIAGTCFNEIIGIIEYARSYNVVPRQMADITIGAGCP